MNHTRFTWLSIDSAPRDSSGSVPTLRLPSYGSLLVGASSSFTGPASFSNQIQFTSSSTVTVSGLLSVTGTFKSKFTTASLNSLTLADGEFTIGQVTGSGASLFFRSGNTTYVWSTTTALVL